MERFYLDDEAGVNDVIFRDFNKKKASKPLSLLDPTAGLRAIISIALLHFSVLLVYGFERSSIMS